MSSPFAGASFTENTDGAVLTLPRLCGGDASDLEEALDGFRRAFARFYAGRILHAAQDFLNDFPDVPSVTLRWSLRADLDAEPDDQVRVVARDPDGDDITDYGMFGDMHEVITAIHADARVLDYLNRWLGDKPLALTNLDAFGVSIVGPGWSRKTVSPPAETEDPTGVTLTCPRYSGRGWPPDTLGPVVDRFRAAVADVCSVRILQAGARFFHDHPAHEGVSVRWSLSPGSNASTSVVGSGSPAEATLSVDVLDTRQKSVESAADMLREAAAVPSDMAVIDAVNTFFGRFLLTADKVTRRSEEVLGMSWERAHAESLAYGLSPALPGAPARKVPRRRM